MSTLKLENIKHENSSSNNLVLDSDGNVIIGTGSDIGSKLSVNSQASFGTDNNNRGIIDYSSNVLSMGTIQSGTANFSTVNVTGGNVGIGNTSPGDYFAGAANLVIGSNNGTDNGITIVTPSNKIGRIHFADGTTGADEYAGFIAYNHSTDEFLFGAGADGGTDLAIKAGTVYAHQYNRGTVASSTPMGTIIFHDTFLSNSTRSISATQTTWTDVLSKVVTPQSANSYFWMMLQHNEHINTQTPNYGGGLRLMGTTGGVSTEVARGGAMEYVTNGTSIPGYSGDHKQWGGWYNPTTASSITFAAQATGTNSQSGNNYYWHWGSNYIANQPGPRLRIVEFT